MALSSSQMIIAVVILFVAFGIYQSYSLKDKVYCTFIRRDRTEINKYAKIKQGRIDFDNSWYNIDPRRVTLKLVWCGIIPTHVKCLRYKFDSNMPLDPTNWNNDYDNPQDRKALDKTEDLTAFLTANKQSIAKAPGKKSFLESLLPVLTIGGFVILGYFIVTMTKKIDLLGAGQNFIEGQLGQLMGK